MSRSRNIYDRIPTGSYCYGYVLSPQSSFRTLEALEQYLASLSDDGRWTERRKHYQYVCCPHWKPISRGRVRCKLIGHVAVIWGQERRTAPLFRKHPKALERMKGFLIGDQVKECRINRKGYDFALPSADNPASGPDYTGYSKAHDPHKDTSQNKGEQNADGNGWLQPVA